MGKYTSKISASIMCGNLLNLGEDLKSLEKNGCDWIHIDVMDAHFVPNLTFGPDFIAAMQKASNMRVDCHFMVTDPELMLSKVNLREGDVFTAHSELKDGDGSIKDYHKMAEEVHSKGALFGLAVNPETPVETLKKNLDCLDTVTLMLVHPGFAGAKMVDGIMAKVGETRKYLDSLGYEKIEISVDGSVSCERAHEEALMGASIFVGGTSGVFRKGMTLEESLKEFRKAVTI